MAEAEERERKRLEEIERLRQEAEEERQRILREPSETMREEMELFEKIQ